MAADADNRQIWSLENSYWDYVKSADLERYRALWHDNFIGWPHVNSKPLRKTHVTDWITANQEKDIKLESYSIEPEALQVTGDIAVVHYRISMNWSAGKDTPAEAETIRIHHTWARTLGAWQIIGGMSAPVNSEGR